MRKDKLLYILGIIAVSVGLLLSIAAIVLSQLNLDKLSDSFFIVSSILGVVALVLLIIRVNIQTKDLGMQSSNPPKVIVKVVDVKDLPKTREQELYEQYEDLYKKNLITKEDLDKKKEELIGKK